MKTANMVRKERKADKFNQLVLSGFTQTDAWYQVNRAKRTVPYEQATVQASQYALSSFVKLRLQAYLRDAKVEDLVTKGQLMAGLMADIDLCRSKDNMTALMSGRRLAMQATEMLKDSLMVSQSGLPDDEIVKRLAGDDPVLQANVRRMLGRAAFDQSESDTGNVTPIKKIDKSTA